MQHRMHQNPPYTGGGDIVIPEYEDARDDERERLSAEAARARELRKV